MKGIAVFIDDTGLDFGSDAVPVAIHSRRNFVRRCPNGQQSPFAYVARGGFDVAPRCLARLHDSSERDTARPARSATKPDQTWHRGHPRDRGELARGTRDGTFYRFMPLAPDIKEAILEGRQPNGMQPEELTLVMPREWVVQQKRVFL